MNKPQALQLVVARMKDSKAARIDVEGAVATITSALRVDYIRPEDVSTVMDIAEALADGAPLTVALVAEALQYRDRSGLQDLLEETELDSALWERLQRVIDCIDF